MDTLCALYSPSMARTAEFTLLLTEANRRANQRDTALALLAEALAEDTHDYSALLRGVLSAAVLAADLGDRDTARDLSMAWERLPAWSRDSPFPAGYATHFGDGLAASPSRGRC